MGQGVEGRSRFRLRLESAAAAAAVVRGVHPLASGTFSDAPASTSAATRLSILQGSRAGLKAGQDIRATTKVEVEVRARYGERGEDFSGLRHSASRQSSNQPFQPARVEDTVEVGARV